MMAASAVNELEDSGAARHAHDLTSLLLRVWREGPPSQDQLPGSTHCRLTAGRTRTVSGVHSGGSVDVTPALCLPRSQAPTPAPLGPDRLVALCCSPAFGFVLLSVTLNPLLPPAL